MAPQLAPPFKVHPTSDLLACRMLIPASHCGRLLGSSSFYSQEKLLSIAPINVMHVTVYPHECIYESYFNKSLYLRPLDIIVAKSEKELLRKAINWILRMSFQGAATSINKTVISRIVVEVEIGKATMQEIKNKNPFVQICNKIDEVVWPQVNPFGVLVEEENFKFFDNGTFSSTAKVKETIISFFGTLAEVESNMMEVLEIVKKLAVARFGSQRLNTLPFWKLPRIIGAYPLVHADVVDVKWNKLERKPFGYRRKRPNHFRKLQVARQRMEYEIKNYSEKEKHESFKFLVDMKYFGAVEKILKEHLTLTFRIYANETLYYGRTKEIPVEVYSKGETFTHIEELLDALVQATMENSEAEASFHLVMLMDIVDMVKGDNKLARIEKGGYMDSYFCVYFHQNVNFLTKKSFNIFPFIETKISISGQIENVVKEVLNLIRFSFDVVESLKLRIFEVPLPFLPIENRYSCNCSSEAHLLTATCRFVNYLF